jgi:hypothetical protein
VKTVELDRARRSELEGRFVGLQAGAARVVPATPEDRVDLEGEGGLLSLELGPPPGGAETWSTDNMFAVPQQVRRRLRESGLEDVVVSLVGGAAPGERDQQPVREGKALPDAAGSG